MAIEPKNKEDEKCGIGFCHLAACQKLGNIKLFVVLMCCVIAVQGTYLGYMVGVLTNLERHFDISSSESGTLLSMYDIGHTVTVLFVGYFGANRHKPRWTAFGIILSCIAMVGLALPNFIFGHSAFEEEIINHHGHYIKSIMCDTERKVAANVTHPACNDTRHIGAYALLALCQLLAGIAAAPFNTLAYVYIDDNVTYRQSPFFLGLLTSMYAFGPALGFALSAGCNFLFVEPMQKPLDLDTKNPNWVGAWWLGFLVCAVLYLLCAVPIFCFPKRIGYKHGDGTENSTYSHEMENLDASRAIQNQEDEEEEESCCQRICYALKDLPYGIGQLLKNPVYVSMALGWVFGSYLVGGYGTYLPKYLETQYSQSASMADIYAGVISIGSIAVSTAVGGYLLTRFNIKPRSAILLLGISWFVIVLTYLFGLGAGCVQPHLQGKHITHTNWDFKTTCNRQCVCQHVHQFDPICSGNVTYFSPCHAGCSYNYTSHEWTDCICTDYPQNTIHGYCPVECNHLPLYLAIMFIGLFIGNLFFMTTMMVVLRCVKDEQKSLALSFASCITNIFGFIPSPIVFGAIIDTSCMAWHSLCPSDKGNCILYNNQDFRHKYHLSNAAFQMVAILAVIFSWFMSRRFKFPEELPQEYSVSGASGIDDDQSQYDE